MTLWIFVNLCESLYTLNVCVCAVTMSECPCIVPCSTHWCACIHNPSVLTQLIDLPLYYHTYWMFMSVFFYLCVFRELAEALLSLWTDWRRRGLAGYQLGGSTLLHTSEFKGQLAATESHHSVAQLFKSAVSLSKQRFYLFCVASWYARMCLCVFRWSSLVQWSCLKVAL